MKKQITVISCAAAALVLLFSSCDTPSYPASELQPGETTSVTLTDYSSYNISAANVTSDYMRGIDASEVKALEECGQKFYDENNIEKDVFEILADKGVNWIRLRIWNDYTAALEDDTITWGPYGYNNLTRTINMAKRAKKYGMKVLLDFHYSDCWADPSKQKCPAMWSDITDADELALAVSNYTSEIIFKMKENGCAPDMVQLGNEMQGGLFKTGSSVANASNYTADYLKAGAEAVNALLPECKIMLHMSNGGKAAYVTTMLSYATAVGNDSEGNALIDVIGVSYYPFYTSHGTDAELKTSLETIKAAGYTPVIAESSFAYSAEAFSDSTDNEFWFDDEATCAKTLVSYNKGLGITQSDGSHSSDAGIAEGTDIISAGIENQAGVMQYLMELSAEVDAASGFFYWGACYLGIAEDMNSSYENQALFDVNGKALPSLNVFNVK